MVYIRQLSASHLKKWLATNMGLCIFVWNLFFLLSVVFDIHVPFSPNPWRHFLLRTSWFFHLVIDVWNHLWLWNKPRCWGWVVPNFHACQHGSTLQSSWVVAWSGVSNLAQVSVLVKMSFDFPRGVFPESPSLCMFCSILNGCIRHFPMSATSTILWPRPSMFLWQTSGVRFVHESQWRTLSRHLVAG